MVQLRSFQVFANVEVIFVLIALWLQCSDAREAIKPAADVGDIIRDLNGLHIGNGLITNNNAPPCSIDIHKDLPNATEPQPLYIKPGTAQFWYPSQKSRLIIPHGAEIELFCSHNFKNGSQANSFRVAKRTKTIKPRCLQDQSFLWNEEKHFFKEFQCQQFPKYAVEPIAQDCGGPKHRAVMYKVGFNITDHRFLETMRICYDDDIHASLYVHHILRPANAQFQRNVKRPDFSQAGYFKEHNMQQYYTQKNQIQQAEKLLSAAQAEKYFDKKSLFLARGHLAAKADMIYASQQRSTFTFFNVAPQWSGFNGGQWANLENEIRNYVAKLGSEVECYTGTWGNMQLEHKNFYLAQDANNNGLLPVPELYYRVIIARSQATNEPQGIAVIGVNNPHATLHSIRQHYVICEDVQQQLPWLHWIDNKNLKKGYLYACAVNEFAAKVDTLPKQLQSVSQLLGGIN